MTPVVGARVVVVVVVVTGVVDVVDAEVVEDKNVDGVVKPFLGLFGLTVTSKISRRFFLHRKLLSQMG